MTMRKPSVAILVPVYNGARFLHETLTSVEQQSYRNLRVLIRDDGSSDDSVDIAEDFARRDSRFSLVVGGERLGAAENSAELLKLTDEPYIKLLMQDDPLDLRHVEKLMLPMLKDPDIVLAAAARRLVDPDGTVLPAASFCEPLFQERATLDGVSVARNVLLNQLNRIGEPSIAIFRAGFFDPCAPFNYGGRTFHAMSDVAMWLTLLSRGPMFYTPEVLSSFRQHSEQRSKDMHVHVQCVLEWAGLLASAVQCGLLTRDTRTHSSAVRVIQWNQQIVSDIIHADTREFDEHLPDVVEAMESLWSTLATQPAQEEPTEPPSLSIRVGPGWEAHREWMAQLAVLSDRFPQLTVSLPPSSDDDGTGRRSADHLRQIFESVHLDIQATGDLTLDPDEPCRTPPTIGYTLPFTTGAIDFLQSYLSSPMSRATDLIA